LSSQASNPVADESTATSGQARTIAFEDTALVERVRGGDMEAYGLLVAKYQDRIYNMIYRMCGRAADAEELAQETFLRALERIDQFRGRSKLYTWLFRIAANLTLSHRRRGARVRFHTLNPPGADGDDSGDSYADTITAETSRRRIQGPEAAAMSRETQSRVTAALSELDDEFRLVVVLRDVEDMDYAQISEVLDLPPGTVKSRLHRARLILREKLADLVSA
jgi:RNA polymerase sigma-70 factor (ECF subfamily)